LTETFSNLAGRFLQALSIVPYDGEDFMQEYEADRRQLGSLFMID
jgi:hypothetical protein